MALLKMSLVALLKNVTGGIVKKCPNLQPTICYLIPVYISTRDRGRGKLTLLLLLSSFIFVNV